MLAAHHRPNNPTGKRLGLPHSHFEKTQLTDSTIYNVQPLKNRRFSSPVAKDGLVRSNSGQVGKWESESGVHTLRPDASLGIPPLHDDQNPVTPSACLPGRGDSS